DTLGSLVDSFFYMQPYPSGLKAAIMILAIAASLVVAALVGYRTWNERRIFFSTVLLVVFVLAVAAPIAEHFFFGTEYPLERTALYYIPIAALLWVFAFDDILVASHSKFRLVGGVSCTILISAMVFHLYRTSNLHHTMTWFYDANTKA